MVTVVMPLYNAENTVALSLESIKNQSAIKVIKEVIVVNDGSTDCSVECVEKFIAENNELNIRLITQKNAGAAAARNTGIEQAGTKYVAFLDADDVWFDDKIEKQLETIRQHPEIRFLGTGWDEKGLRIGFKKVTELYNGTVKDVCVKNFPVTPSVLMERAIFDEIGMFNAELRYAEDINFFQKVAAKGNYYFLPEKLVEIDVGKNFFAESGQSANLKEMHRGTLRNIKELRENKDISWGFWLAMRLFYQIKYCRRIVMRQARLCLKQKGQNK